MTSLGADSSLVVDTTTSSMSTHAFLDYSKIENMPNSFCIGSGRRFRGSIYGQDDYAHCPHCKTTSNHLGAPGITATLASGFRFVVPDHVNPVLVAETEVESAQYVVAECPAEVTWDISGDAALEVTAALDISRLTPDQTADANLVASATTDAALGDWMTSADSELVVTGTPLAVMSWDVNADASLLTKASVSTDGPGIWRVDSAISIIATPLS